MPVRASHRSSAAAIAGRQAALRTALDLGARLREARRRRGWSQGHLGGKVGLSPSRVGQLEAGQGAGGSLEVWYGLAAALELPLRIELGRDRTEDTADAGHLQIQELVLRLGRRAGFERIFELPTRPQDPALSSDVCLRDDRRRVLVLNECWNTFGSINGAIRSTRRKLAEAEALAVAAGGEAGPYRVTGCWIVRDTRRNRELVSRYPEVFASTFTGSSAGWVRALNSPTSPPPAELGLVWCDLSASRLIAWRQRG